MNANVETNAVQTPLAAVVPGNYFKKTTRTGMAYTTLNTDGTTSYTNRRGEVVATDNDAFNAKWIEGYDFLDAREVDANGRPAKKEKAVVSTEVNPLLLAAAFGNTTDEVAEVTDEELTEQSDDEALAELMASE